MIYLLDIELYFIQKSMNATVTVGAKVKAGEIYWMRDEQNRMEHSVSFNSLNIVLNDGNLVTDPTEKCMAFDFEKKEFTSPLCSKLSSAILCEISKSKAIYLGRPSFFQPH